MLVSKNIKRDSAISLSACFSAVSNSFKTCWYPSRRVSQLHVLECPTGLAEDAMLRLLAVTRLRQVDIGYGSDEMDFCTRMIKHQNHKNFRFNPSTNLKTSTKLQYSMPFSCGTMYVLSTCPDRGSILDSQH